MEYRSEKECATGLDDAATAGSKDDGRWRLKLRDRAERLKYLRTGERYWYSQEWFGSEKRKKPA